MLIGATLLAVGWIAAGHDPAPSGAASGSLERLLLPPVADTTVVTSDVGPAPDYPPMGDRPALVTGFSDVGAQNFTALVRYDLSVLPADAIVERAVLRARAVTVSPAWPDDPVVAGLAVVMSPWDEATTTGASAPHLGPRITSQLARTGLTVEWDVTSTVHNWLAGSANFGFALHSESFGRGFFWMAYFDSREASLPPELDLLWRPSQGASDPQRCCFLPWLRASR